MRDLFGSLRSAVLQLRRSPGFAILAILVLTLGVGATAAVFTFMRGILLQPLPYPESNRLLILCETNQVMGDHCVAAPPNAADWADRARTVEAIVQGREWGFLLRHDGRARSVDGGLASPSLFPLLRTQPSRGRLFAADEITQERAPVAVLSHSLWSTWFNADPAIVGKTIELDKRPFRVIGVLPASFALPGLEGVELWVPFHFDPRAEERRSWRGFMTLARLAPGATPEQAALELQTIQQQLAIEHPATNQGWGVRVASFKSFVVSSARPRLLVFSAAVLLLLLITCANVAALLLVRATARQHEFALRVALGARGSRLLSDLIMEAVTIGLIAGLLSFGVAWSTVRVFVHFAPASVPRLQEVQVDAVVFAFALASALLTSLLVGLVPAMRVARTDLYSTLREGAAHLTARTGLAARRALVVLEVAVALALLVGSTLLVQSFRALLDWQPGFEREHLTVVSLFAPSETYGGERMVPLLRELEQSLASIQGVESVGAASAGPLFGGDEPGRFRIQGQQYATEQDAATLRWYDVSPGFFSTLGLPLLRGRMLTERDGLDAQAVAVINQAAVRRYFGDDNPVGQRIDWLDAEDTFEIVGVVADAAPFNPDEPRRPEIYWSNRQRPRVYTYFLLRTSVPPARIARAIEQTLQARDPDFSVGTARTFDDMVDRRLVSPRFQMMLIAVLGAISLLLAAAGVFGVLAYAVAVRRGEFGIRMALGARHGQIVQSVLGDALRLGAIGIAIGSLAGLALSRTMQSLLVGTRPTNAVAYLVPALLLLLVCVLAAIIPALRTTQIQPQQILRT